LRDEGEFNAPRSKADVEALDNAEKDFFSRWNRQLSIKRIGAWLDEQGGNERILAPLELIDDEDSYIRFVYALLYGDSRNDFGYAVEEKEAAETGSVSVAGYAVPDIRFRRALKREKP
jgi:hypothetical protein